MWVPATALALLAVAATGAAVAMSDGTDAPSAEPSPHTVEVTRGTLSAMISVDGILTYRARPDGSPYSAVNWARGIYTALPASGDQVDCGGVLYRVDETPVLLLCGALPAYRDLAVGATGQDVRQLNENLHALGYDTEGGDNTFTGATRDALEQLQKATGLDVTGELGLDDAVFLPGAVRIAQVVGRLGGPADPAAEVLRATSDTQVVQVALEPWQQGDVKVGDPAQITLPGGSGVTGKVEQVGTVTQDPAAQDGKPAAATLPAFLTLDDTAKAAAFNQAPVAVDITTTGVDNALSVPVAALVGKAGGGYAVDVLRENGVRELVPVTLGLFDTTAGRVQIDGAVQEGDSVAVPSP